MSVETWRVIPSATGYEASSFGRVRNAHTGHVLRPQWNTRGYLKVNLGRTRQALVQRLVCEAFHGAPGLPSHHADHVNFDRVDNRPENLRWLPAYLNAGRQLRYGRAGWEMDEDDMPDDYVPLTDAQLHDLERVAVAAGWS